MFETPAAHSPAQTDDSQMAARAAAVVRGLAGDIGARPAGSAAEMRAAQFVAEGFEQAGVAAVQLPVRVRASGSWEALVYLPLGLLAILLSLIEPISGAVAGCLVLAGCCAELSGRSLLTRWLPRLPSRNVLAIVPPRRQEIRRLIIMANLDTVTPAAARHLSATPSTARTASYTVAALVPGVAALVVLALSDAAQGTMLRLLSATLLLAWLLRVGWLNWQAEGSPGAATNSSGVAALVAAAEQVHRHPPDWIEVWFLATSAGEAHADGLRAFLRANSFEREATFFVNVQSVGTGALTVATREGVIRRQAAAPFLARWLEEAGVERPQLVGPRRMLRRLTLAGVAARAGYSAVTLVGSDELDLIPHDGRISDTPDTVSAPQIERAANVLVSLLTRADVDAAERNRLALLARASSAALMDTPAPSGQ
jgi:hypothetical protein